MQPTTRSLQASRRVHVCIQIEKKREKEKDIDGRTGRKKGRRERKKEGKGRGLMFLIIDSEAILSS